MTPPAWAYQADNFDPPPDEELICSVCRSVFCDPVQSPCNHVFCRSCINKWLDANRNCPICRKRTTKYTIQEVVPIIKNMIMKLTLYCCNKEKGCEEKFTLESCEGHLKVCSYETVRCTNKPCKEMVLRKDLEDHELNNCHFRYVRCETCFLKILSIVPMKHNCVKALRKRLREKNEMIKSKNLKIKKLQDEIKDLKEAQQDSSDMSSIGSLSTSDVMLNLPVVSDSLDSSSFASESDGDYNSTQLVNLLSDGFRAYHDLFYHVSNEDESIEYPRSSSPVTNTNSAATNSTATNSIATNSTATNSTASNSAMNPLPSTFNEEPQVRRPTKRRLPVRTLDSSEDENGRDMEPPPAPSPKRTSWRQFLGEPGQSSSQASADIQPVPAQGSMENNLLPSSSTASGSHDEAQPSNSNIPFKLCPRDRRSSSDEVDILPVRRNPRSIFERTRALLEQYSLESDPEWLPPNPMDAEDVQSSDSDSSFHPPDYPDHFASSSDSSSSEDGSSSNSSYVDAQSRTNMLFGYVFPDHEESES